MTHRLNKIFGKKEGSGRQAKKPSPEAPRDDQLTRGTTKKLSVYPKQLVAGTGQSVGLHREHNEDALLHSPTVARMEKTRKRLVSLSLQMAWAGIETGKWLPVSPAR